MAERIERHNERLGGSVGAGLVARTLAPVKYAPKTLEKARYAPFFQPKRASRVRPSERPSCSPAAAGIMLKIRKIDEIYAAFIAQVTGRSLPTNFGEGTQQAESAFERRHFPLPSKQTR
jgi:hypothetical protein